jgi:hypothetical protein
MCGTGPSILETHSQYGIFGMSRDDRLFVSGMSIALDGSDETRAEHRR